MLGPLLSANHAAADFGSRVPGRLRMKVIRAAVDHHSPSDDVPHTETVCPYGQMRLSMTQHEWRKVPRVVRVVFPGWIIVAACLRKVLSGAGAPLMDVKGKKISLTILWKSREIGHHQDPPTFLIKPDLSG